MNREQYRGRDKRNKGWFWVDNEYLSIYAKVFGAVGTSIYISLCRHANIDTQKCFPSMETIAEELNISRKTVSKYIRLFELNGLISIDREIDETTKRRINNVYTLLDKSEWESHGKPLPKEKPWVTEGKSHGNVVPSKETKIKDTNNREDKKSSPYKDNKIRELASLFKEVNPTYERVVYRKNQGEALVRLVKKFGYDKVEDSVKELPRLIVQKGCPQVTTPIQLENNLGRLVAFTKQNNKKGKKITFTT